MNNNDLIFLLRKHARKLCYKTAFKKEIVNGPVDLMFEAAEAIEKLVKAKQWTLVDDELPPNEEEVLLCVEMRCQPEVAIRSIVSGIYTDGKHYLSNSWPPLNIDDLQKDDYIIPQGWWEVTRNYIFGTLCKDIEEIDGTVIAWMPLPEMPEKKANGTI